MRINDNVNVKNQVSCRNATMLESMVQNLTQKRSRSYSR